MIAGNARHESIAGGVASAQWFCGPLAVWVPMIVLQSYLYFTVFLYFFGPVDWSIPSAAKLLLFLAVNYGGLLLGYRWGVQRTRANLRARLPRSAGVVRVQPWVLRLVLFSMLFSIFSMTIRLFAIRGSVSEVLATITSPGEAYIQAQLIAQMDRDGLVMPIQGFSWAFRISTILAIFNVLYLPIAVACWHWLPRSYKPLFWLTILCSLIYAVGMGAQSGIGFMLFSVLPVLLYKVFVERTAIRITRSDRLTVRRSRAKGRLVLAGFMSLIVLVATVAYFQVDRAETSGHEISSGDALVGPFGTPTSRGFPLFESGRLGFGVVMACKYMSHGYTGLALAMELPFEWTYGLGWSKGLQVVLRDYLGGPDLFDRSYLVRNEIVNQWPALVWWSTIFPWIASDTTFFGTVLVMLLIGFGLGKVWMDIVANGNPLGFVLLGQLFVLVFMFPANNALAQTIDGLFAFGGGLALFFLGRRSQRGVAVRDAVA